MMSALVSLAFSIVALFLSSTMPRASPAPKHSLPWEKSHISKQNKKNFLPLKLPTVLAGMTNFPISFGLVLHADFCLEGA